VLSTEYSLILPSYPPLFKPTFVFHATLGSKENIHPLQYMYVEIAIGTNQIGDGVQILKGKLPLIALHNSVRELVRNMSRDNTLPGEPGTHEI
jgi:hypothetical protein